MSTNEVNMGSNKLYNKLENGKHRAQEKILSSWNNEIKMIISEGEDSKGLRKAQFGALCSIRAHWTISKKDATIVMPTGTGKTETILATIVTEKIKRSLIIVPSNLLRSQVYEKAKTLGILYDIGILSEKILNPNVLMLAENNKNLDEFKNHVNRSNIIVTTMSLVNNMSKEAIDFLSSNIELVIIDEAHHISSKTWKKSKEYFKQKKILQFTATPFREDGKKVDGKIIYNYPLSLAQEEGYFKKIEFIPIEEYNKIKSDEEIAKRAVEALRNDIEQGLDHILLVRTGTMDKAEHLYKEIYYKKYKELNPVIITSRQSAKEKRKNMDLLKSLQSKIVVCVDMFGEGIDIPNLKIAAIHDKYKSLPITLQFIGRFARSKKGLGDAKIITNIADGNISEAIKDLYEKDTDWNTLLPKKSNEYINKEISIQNIVDGFKKGNLDEESIFQMRPKVSMMAYTTRDVTWDYTKWIEVLNEDICKFSINNDEKIFVVIEPREVRLGWTNQKDLCNLEWNYYVIYWNKEKKIVFLNTTDKTKGNKLVNTIFNKIEPIKSESVFKCLHGIKRLSLGTVGLNSGIDGSIRYKMFAGIDIAEGIAQSSKSNCYKSNVFGSGYDGNGKVSIGCSYKGTIWSKWVESIAYWKIWCNKIIDKVLDPNINVKDIMEGVLIPQVIEKIPAIFPYRIDWPNELDFDVKQRVSIENVSGEFNIQDIDIKINNSECSDNQIIFSVKNDYFIEKFSLTIHERKCNIKSLGNVSSYIKIGNNQEVLLSTYLEENPPTVWFVDGSSIQGNIFIKLKESEITKFPEKYIFKWSWETLGVDITVESQFDKSNICKKTNSIQYNVIKKLKEDGKYSIIFDDDGAGEIADIVAIKEKEESIKFELFHCKYSHKKEAGSRVSDLYEVCGQADKSVYWKQDIIGMIERMKYRETLRIQKNKPSRFELGDMSKLDIIKNKLLMQPSELDIIIVQPGVKGEKITDDMHSILSTSYSYCMDTFSVRVSLICS